MTEQELAAKVVDWLQAQHWEVYQEVSCYGNVCDIVATRAGVLWAIECKTTLGLSVMAQAHYWTRLAHYSSVAVPKPKRARDPFATLVLGNYGIGLLNVTMANPFRGYEAVTVGQRATLHRKILPKLGKSLREEQKTWAAAGNAEGKRFTPFQGTKQRVQSLVGRAGRLPFKKLIAMIEHHYASDASARNSLRQLIEGGIIEGVTLRREGRELFVEAVAAKGSLIG